MKDFLGGDPIAGSKALRELADLGDFAEQEVFSRPLDYGKTIQVRRRWLRYMAAREDSVGPRLLDRLKGKNEFGDKHSAAFLCAGISKARNLSGAMYTAARDDIDDLRPGDADAAVMAYGYAGADLASIFNLINQSSYAWEKLSTFAFRSACAACARINTGNSWVLERLVTHRWDRDGLELEEVANSPDARVDRIAIDDSEISGESNYTFLVWRRGDVADEVLRGWSSHSHWRVRWFGAQILSSLGFVRTVTPIIEWLGNEQVPRVREALLHALERSDSKAGADALLDTFESTAGEGAAGLAKVGWRASDNGRAVKALTSILEADSNTGAEALVSMARLGFRPPGLMKFLDSHDHYRRLNAMLALGYLGDQQDARRLTAMQAEAAAWLERIYISASMALLGIPGAAVQLHRELIAASGEPDFSKRIDVFFLHRYLQNAVLGGLEAGGEETRELLNAWRSEIEPLEPIPTAAQQLPSESEQTGAEDGTPLAVVTTSALSDPPPSAPPRATPDPVPNPGESKLGQAEPEEGSETASGDGNRGNGGRATKPKTGDKDKGLLELLERRAGIGGVGAGILLILYRTLVFPKLGATQANLFMILIYGAVFAMLALWAYQLTRKVTFPILLLLFGSVLGWLGRSTLRSEGDTPREPVQAQKDSGLQVRGIVEDSRGNSIPNALVSVPGYGKDAVFSDAGGSFELPSHAQSGETIQLHAEKPPLKPANLPAFKVGFGSATLTLGDPDTSGNAPGTRGAVSQAGTSSKSANKGGPGRDAAQHGGVNTGSAASGISSQTSNSVAEHCESFQEFQGDESALATLAERAFSRQFYDCTVTYLEQARKVQSSGVWERDYPLLAASYLLARKDRSQFRATLQEMLGEMRQPNSYLHHGPTIGFALANITYVRSYVDLEGQNYLDQITAEAIKVRGSIAG